MENSINCHFYTPKGCKALMYVCKEKDSDLWIDNNGNVNLCNDICANCKFKKTIAQWEDIRRNKHHSDIRGFYLIFDGKNKGFFTSIIDADKWLKTYFDENKQDEYMPSNALFDDYNILFVNHNIRFVLNEEDI